jgi:hypothetical protein
VGAKAVPWHRGWHGASTLALAEQFNCAHLKAASASSSSVEDQVQILTPSWQRRGTGIWRWAAPLCVFTELLKAAHRNKRRRSPGDSWIAVYGFLAYIVQYVLFIFISFQKHTVSLLFSSLKDGVSSGSCWLLL